MDDEGGGELAGRRDDGAAHRELSNLVDALPYFFAGSSPYPSVEGRQRLQRGTDGTQQALHVGRDQILTADSDHVSFSSLALRYISNACS
jgi:hypothetical protein